MADNGNSLIPSNLHNRVVYTADSYFGNHLAHYGLDHNESKVGRGSGRYGYGTGKNPFQHSSLDRPIRDEVSKLKKEGMSLPDIAKALGYSSTTELRKYQTLERERYERQAQASALKLVSEGYGPTEIAKKLGLSNESTARDLIARAKRNSKAETKTTSVDNVVTVLKRELDERDIVGLDITKGAENIMGISSHKLATAVAKLKDEGYVVGEHKIPQATKPSQKTTIMVLSKPGDPKDTYREVELNKEKIGIVNNTSDDYGISLKSFQKNVFDKSLMKNLDSKRVKINYAETGGKEKDGLIELRPGAEGLDLGGKRYAQVRIGVDGDYYLKGMAVYGDPKDFPKGVDVIFNTNKKSTKPMLGKDADGNPSADFGVLKVQDKNPMAENPFGAAIAGGSAGQRGYINIVSEEGDWGKWTRALSSQFLSKQPEQLVKQQLADKVSIKQEQLAELREITNPVIRKRLMEKFADKCDSEAIDLKAAPVSSPAGLQTQAVLIPIPSLKNDEVYSTVYPPGTRLALVRHPHAGRFEIADVVVTNRNREGRRVIGLDSPDAIGVNSKIASQLSGADFDGDSVVVIPNNDRRIKAEKPLKGLEGFDPSESYPAYEGMPRVGKKVSEGGDGFQKQKQMGMVSNLITDMTIAGANEDELARAVRHSMVIIDAEKHNLDWKRSEKENRITELKHRYQGTNPNGTPKGSATIISRAKSQEYVPWRDERTKRVDPKTGDYIYAKPSFSKTYSVESVSEKTGRTYWRDAHKDEFEPSKLVFNSQHIATLPDGTRVRKNYIKSGKMAEAKDARTLMSGHKNRIEPLYADYANTMKQMARDVRLEALNTKIYKRSPTARKEYEAEVRSLQAKTDAILRSKSYERKAQILANIEISKQLEVHPDWREDKDKQIKLRTRSINAARAVFYPEGKPKYTISDREWEAIEAHALSATGLKSLIDAMDDDYIKQRSMPKTKNGLTAAQMAFAKRWLKNHTLAETAARLGVSTSTLYDAGVVG